MGHRLLSCAVLPFQGATQGLWQPGGLQGAADISAVVVAAISALLLLAVVLLLMQLRKLLATLEQQIGPVADRARRAADNVECISAIVREDVQKIHSSVAGLADQLKGASERMEGRVEEFNALMDVVQGEAEAVLLDTAAAVQGVRAGARTIGEAVVADEPGAEPAEALESAGPGEEAPAAVGGDAEPS